MERINDHLNWLAVYTRPNCERKVSGILQQQGIEVYCPLVKVVRQWSDRKKKLQVPLIPSYVFVRVSEFQRRAVLRVPGILNFVFWLGRPAEIRDREIFEMKCFIDEFPYAKAEKSVGIGDQVRITYGSLKDYKGVVIDRKKGKVILLLEQLGIELKAEIPEEKISL